MTMSSENLSRFKFYVLGLKNGFRGYPIVNELKRLNYDVEIVWGIDGRDSNVYISSSGERVSKFFNNRILTNLERATTLGHWRMFNIALEKNADFSVFLEDDAKLCDVDLLRESLEEIAQSFDVSNTDSLWLLIRRHFNELGTRHLRRKEHLFSRSLTIPTLSSAYVMNRHALLSISNAVYSRENTGYAPDFPAFYADFVRFKVPRKSIFDVTGEESVIGNERWLMARFETFHLVRQFSRFIALSWILEGRKYSSLKSYLMYFHGRKVVHFKSKFIYQTKNEFS